jgi:hypothetical protein
VAALKFFLGASEVSADSDDEDNDPEKPKVHLR